MEPKRCPRAGIARLRARGRFAAIVASAAIASTSGTSCVGVGFTQARTLENQPAALVLGEPEPRRITTKELVDAWGEPQQVLETEGLWIYRDAWIWSGVGFVILGLPVPPLYLPLHRASTTFHVDRGRVVSADTVRERTVMYWYVFYPTGARPFGEFGRTEE